MDGLKKTLKVVTDFLGIVIPSISFLVIFVTFMISICSRYFLKVPMTWSYEVSVLGYMWTMFFGVGKAIENDEHVVFGLVYDTLKPFGQFLCRFIYNLALVILLVLCIKPCCENLMGSTMVTGVLKLPYTVVFAPFIYMLLETIIRSAINVYDAVKEYKAIKEGGKVA